MKWYSIKNNNRYTIILLLLFSPFIHILAQVFERDSVLLDGSTSINFAVHTLQIPPKILQHTYAIPSTIWCVETSNLSIDWIIETANTEVRDIYSLHNGTILIISFEVQDAIEGIKLQNFDIDGNLIWENFNLLTNENSLNYPLFSNTAEGFYIYDDYMYLPGIGVYEFAYDGELVHQSVISDDSALTEGKIIERDSQLYFLKKNGSFGMPEPNSLWIQDTISHIWTEVLDTLPISVPRGLESSVILGDTLFYIGYLSFEDYNLRPIIGIDLHTYAIDTFENDHHYISTSANPNDIFYDEPSKSFLYFPVSHIGPTDEAVRYLSKFDLVSKTFLWNLEISAPWPNLAWFNSQKPIFQSGDKLLAFWGKLYKLNPQTGEIIWDYDIRSESGCEEFECTSIYTIDNDIILCGNMLIDDGTSTGFVHAVLYRLRETDTGIKVEEFSPHPSITLSPIPASDQLYLSSMANMTHVAVYDIHGSRILSMDIPELSEWQISVADMPPGIYVLQVRDRAGVISSQRWVKA